MSFRMCRLPSVTRSREGAMFREEPAERKGAVRRVITSPWMVLVFLVIGWGPPIISDLMLSMRPDLADRFGPETLFGMGWLAITFVCTVLAVAVGVVHLLLFISRRLTD